MTSFRSLLGMGVSALELPCSAALQVALDLESEVALFDLNF